MTMTPMTVERFGSFDELKAAMTEREAAAADRLLDEQRACTYGTTWVWSHGGLLVFGRIHRLDEIPEDEREDTEQMEQRHYLFGEAWSAIVPFGELGDTHRSQMWPISQQAFDEARQHGWQLVEPLEQLHLWTELSKLDRVLDQLAGGAK